ncbi:MAG: valine--tRNA ligase [Patescibacteria group bacterium]
MKKELAKAYVPQENENDIYRLWESSGFFNPDNAPLPKTAQTYTIILPPPNITAKLHIGHSAMLAIEDLLIRYKRMNGYRTLWLPGTDHAAIATQMVVEKKIFEETGQTRHDLGKEILLEKIWEFLRNTQSEILGQMRKLGASLDWSREAFTLDQARQKAVNRLFVEMYQEGAIYRGERIVNWCPHCQSTLADDEVEYSEQTTKLYTFKYAPDFPITISTTRPETKLGDTAVAVNPKDERYQKYLGQEFSFDFVGQKLTIKIIGDRNVDPDFGTGALGVTPAHSMVDWQMAQENDLAVIKVINEQGLIREGFGNYSGLSVKDAREKLIAELKEKGLLISEEEVIHNISTCYRCDTPIEPLPSKQWFVSVDCPLERLGGKSLKEKALAVAQEGTLKFIPERFNKRYQDWMSNLHDWCISRQIWFGHPIPVWYRGAEIYCDLKAPEGEGWVQDVDTLDTWFSSGMWTFSTLGWPDNYRDGKKFGDLANFHPTQVLETGYEILTLWVSRMVMMSMFALGEMPFESVYLHGTILDKHGKKMSKSKGNGVDPLVAINEYGADALRLSLLMGSTPGNDSRYSADKVEAKRNFINKLWNIARYILAQPGVAECQLNSDPEPKTIADRWILAELSITISEVRKRLDNFEFSLAAEILTEFTRDKLADWYLEIAKIEGGKTEILNYLLLAILRLWHPFIPFVTEKIWQSFQTGVLMIEQWPTFNLAVDEQAKSTFTFWRDLIVAIRNSRSANKIAPGVQLEALVFSVNNQKDIALGAELITKLKTGLSSLTFVNEDPKPENAITVVVQDTIFYLLAAIDPEKEAARITKEREVLEKLIFNLSERLANQEFVSRAPAKIVDQEKEKLAAYQLELNKLKETIL